LTITQIAVRSGGGGGGKAAMAELAEVDTAAVVP